MSERDLIVVTVQFHEALHRILVVPHGTTRVSPNVRDSKSSKTPGVHHLGIRRGTPSSARVLKRSNSARRACVISRAPAGCVVESHTETIPAARAEGDKIPRRRRLGGRPRELLRRIPIRARLIRTSHQLTHVTMAAIASAASVAPQVRAAPSRASVHPSSVPLVLRAGARASSDAI